MTLVKINGFEGFIVSLKLSVAVSEEFLFVEGKLRDN